MTDPGENMRVFKTAWFSKAASKARIQDAELCADIQEILKGQCVDLGGAVFKKRLNRNMHRSIVIRGGCYWVYAYLFAKKDRENIDARELAGFRMLADTFANATEAIIAKALKDNELTEICHETKVQE
jgi:hypothetical protein